MDWADFLNSYTQIFKSNPNYRLGQHFINLFISNEHLIETGGLWEKNGTAALDHIHSLMLFWQWDYNDMPLMEKGMDDCLNKEKR